MPTLQDMIDAAFGTQADRAPQSPSALSAEQDRKFSERAKKIEQLKQARLAGPEKPAPELVFEVVRHRGHWRVLHHNKHSTPHADQNAAIQAAKDLAKKKRELGHRVKVELVRTDGQVVGQNLDDQDG